jgi:peptidyl-prolyl cis-trans isomerase A (cyclophilin A)
MRTLRWTHIAIACLAACATAALAFAQQPSEAKQAAEREPGLYATFQTSLGDITVKLFEKEAPVTVKNFVGLAEGRKEWRDPQSGEMVKRPLYDGTTFHRVIPGFMIQGGDPSGTGSGDAGLTIPDEIDPALKFDVPGRLAMANSGPNTGSCQFFITDVPTPHLDGAHTIFGQVTEGEGLVSQIAAVPRDENDVPLEPVKLNRVVVERVGPAPEGK